LKAWPIVGIALVSLLLLGAHGILLTLWLALWGTMPPAALLGLKIALLVLGCSFILSSLLNFYFSGWAVRALYWVASVWLGLFNYLFFSLLLARIIAWMLSMTSYAQQLLWLSPRMAYFAVTLSVVVVLAGMFNARMIRLKKIKVQLERLPEQWRGRKLLLMSDLHLGNMNGVGFARRVAYMAKALAPDAIVIPGDLFDGAKCDADRLLAPLGTVKTRFGTYFSAGNHDEFGGFEHYVDAIRRAGIHILNGERVILDELQLIGVSYHDTTYPLRMRMILEKMNLNEGAASILLNHVPNRLPMAEAAGVSLTLSGHTHGGQLFPFTLAVKRAYGRFTYGLNQFGKMQVYTSTGVGAWGPPMRIGTHPELVLIELDRAAER